MRSQVLFISNDNEDHVNEGLEVVLFVTYHVSLCEGHHVVAYHVFVVVTYHVSLHKGHFVMISQLRVIRNGRYFISPPPIVFRFTSSPRPLRIDFALYCYLQVVRVPKIVSHECYELHYDELL